MVGPDPLAGVVRPVVPRPPVGLVGEDSPRPGARRRRRSGSRSSRSRLPLPRGRPRRAGSRGPEGASQRAAQSKRARSCRAESQPIAAPISAPAVPVQPTRPRMWTRVVEMVEGLAVGPMPVRRVGPILPLSTPSTRVVMCIASPLRSPWSPTWHDAFSHRSVPAISHHPQDGPHGRFRHPLSTICSTGMTLASPKRGHLLHPPQTSSSPRPRTRTLLRPTAADPVNPHRGGAGSAAGRAPATPESARQVGTPIPHLRPPVSSSGGPQN